MIRVAVSYAVIAWLALQVGDVTFEPLGVPRWVMVSLIVTAVLGFPVAVTLAWFYEVGDRGLVRDTAGEGAVRPAVHGVRRYADLRSSGCCSWRSRCYLSGSPTWVSQGRAVRPSQCCHSRT